MKKLLPISLIINAVLIIAVALTIFGLPVSRSFSPISAALPSMGGGAPAAEPYYDYVVAPEEGMISPSGVDNASAGERQAADVDRIVIQNADVAIVVADVEARMNDIQTMTQQMGGFVVSSNLYQNYTSNNIEVPEAQVVIRVPSEKLEEALEQIEKDVVEVQNETRSGQDVTAEYVDLKSRLANLEAAEEQLSKIMEDANRTEDVVNIFNQLVYYREQIELVKGQMQYYEDAAALSAITIRIIAEESIQPIEIGGWEPKGAARDAIQDLIFFWQDFVDFMIRFIIYTLPAWITIGIPLYLVFIGGRALYRRMRKNKKVEVVEEEKKESGK